jgi:hypothetical protein
MLGLEGATTVTISRNEIMTALNKPEDFILALVEVNGDYPADPPLRASSLRQGTGSHRGERKPRPQEASRELNASVLALR